MKLKEIKYLMLTELSRFKVIRSVLFWNFLQLSKLNFQECVVNTYFEILILLLLLFENIKFVDLLFAVIIGSCQYVIQITIVWLDQIGFLN